MLNYRYLRMRSPDDPGGSPTPTPTPTPTPAPAPSGKTFSEEYVTSIREESKNHRLAYKTTLSLLRKVLGLKEDEDVDETKVDGFLAGQADKEKAILAKANSRLLSAEIRALEGYDAKLLERLLDRSKVTIADDGTITGLKEAAEELAKEFPALKSTTSPKPNPTPGNPALPSTGTGSLAELQTQYEAARKEGRTLDAIRLNNEIFQLTHKKE